MTDAKAFHEIMSISLHVMPPKFFCKDSFRCYEISTAFLIMKCNHDIRFPFQKGHLSGTGLVEPNMLFFSHGKGLLIPSQQFYVLCFDCFYFQFLEESKNRRIEESKKFLCNELRNSLARPWYLVT